MTRISKTSFLCWLKKNWLMIGIVASVTAFGTKTQIGLASGNSKDATQDQIIAQQHELQKQQAQMLEHMQGQIDVILLMLGIKVADSTIARWKLMPKALPLDSLGNPIPGAEWLCVSDKYLLGQTFKWENDSMVFVRTEWDER